MARQDHAVELENLFLDAAQLGSKTGAIVACGKITTIKSKFCLIGSALFTSISMPAKWQGAYLYEGW